MIPGPGYRRPAVGVADEDDRPVLGIDDALGRFHVTIERKRRILHDADVETVLLQDVVDALPAGAVDETPVNEDYVRRCHRALLSRQWWSDPTPARSAVKGQASQALACVSSVCLNTLQCV